MEGKDRTVLIIGTLDTKSEEIKYIRDRILQSGVKVLILDNGILGEPQGIQPDVSARETALAAGTTLEEVRKKQSRGEAIEEMIKGCEVLVRKLFKEGRIDGAISIGGAEGGVMAARAMQVLPAGFPKIIVTPLASGVRQFGPFVGTRDIMIMHSLVDVVGINDITRNIFDNAVAAIIGMVKKYQLIEIRSQRNVAITALGTVQKAVDFIRIQLQEKGYQPIIFHANGVGGRVMEEFIEQRIFCGVIDLCTNEITNHLVKGFHDAGPFRLEAAGKVGIPQIVIPGCVDFFVYGSAETIPEKWRDRKKYYHNPEFTLIRPSHDEMREIARIFTQKLNNAKGPVSIILPLRGMSIGGLPGGTTHDPIGDRIFFETLKEGLKQSIKIYELDCHINEEFLANKVVEEFLRIMETQKLD